MDDYEVVGEEITVPDMHTRKKMMFDRASSTFVQPVCTYSFIPGSCVQIDKSPESIVNTAPVVYHVLVFEI